MGQAESPIHAFICDYLGGGSMKNLLSTMKATMSIAIAFSVSLMATAAPNCPPQYQEICKQLIKTLDDNNDGKHFYQWDGTHLIIDGNFALYDSINHSSTDHRTGNVNATPKEYALSKDYFPHLLNQMVAASQSGQRVYLHLFYGWGLDAYTVAGVSNVPPVQPLVAPVLAPPNAPPTPVNVPNQTPPKAPPKIPQAVPQPMIAPVLAPVLAPPTPVNVPNPAPPKAPPKIPQAVPQPMIAPVLAPPTPVNVPNQAPPKAPPKIPQAVPQPANQPTKVTVIHGVTNRQGVPVDKATVNGHFVTDTAGNHLDQESRAYLFDNNNDVWSCMVAGLGTRQRAGENGEIVAMGHAETLEFRSTHISHIPANHPMHPGCLISVQQ